jgi:drug/metabolite transporter (DMT)-like permease
MKSLIHNPNIAFFISIFGSSISGLSPILVRLSEVGSNATGFYRFFFSLPFLFIWLALLPKQKEQSLPSLKVKPTTQKETSLILLAGVLLGVDVALWNYSIFNTTVANASILANLSSIYVALMGYFFMGEKLSFRFVMGMLTALLGSMVLIGLNFSASLTHVLGDVCALLASITFGTYMMVVGELRKTLVTPTIMLGIALVGSCTLFLIGSLNGDIFIPLTTSGWVVLLAIAFFASVVGHGLVNYALAYVSPALTTVGMLIQPVLCSIIAWFMFDESLSMEKIAGIILVLIGISFAQQDTK